MIRNDQERNCFAFTITLESGWKKKAAPMMLLNDRPSDEKGIVSRCIAYYRDRRGENKIMYISMLFYAA